MRCVRNRVGRNGIALIVVMIAVTVLSVMAALFAFSMKVETRLAQNANSDTELMWLGRSGIEYARWYLAESFKQPPDNRYHALHQYWAGGPGSDQATNNVSFSPLPDGGLEERKPLGNGTFKITIRDNDRKANINLANEMVMDSVMRLAGFDAGEGELIRKAITDWIDPDNVGEAEAAYYQSLDPPYFAKNQPMDDISELLLVRGITQDIYGRLTNYLTTLSGGRINVNTASAENLQLLPHVDNLIADKIIEFLGGPDGARGTSDDTPVGSAGELQGLLLSAGLPQGFINITAGSCSWFSGVFEVEVDAEIAGYHQYFVGELGVASARDIQILSFKQIPRGSGNSQTGSEGFAPPTR
jgi:general secretion pathway protein K